ILATDSLKNYSEETVTSKNKSIVKSTFNTSVFYSTVIDSVFIASSAKELVDLAHEKTNLNPELERIYNTTSDSKTASLILKHDNTSITSFFTYSDLPFKTFSNYTALDADVEQNQIFINGITQATDSTKSFINVFKNSIPQVNQIQNMVPYTSDGFLSFTFNNFRTFESNLNLFNKKDSLVAGSSLFENIAEVGVVYENNKQAVVLNSLDIIATKDELLSELIIIGYYSEIDIYNFSKPELFNNDFHTLTSSLYHTLYCVLVTYFVFANDLELIKCIVG